MAPPSTTPITVAIVDDYDVVVMGLANMFNQYRDRVVVTELVSNEPVVDTVDIALYDSPRMSVTVATIARSTSAEASHNLLGYAHTVEGTWSPTGRPDASPTHRMSVS
jgi:hypothetical protein